MKFEFDPVKSAKVKADPNRGIDFVEAQALWEDEQRMTTAAKSETEPRYAIVARLGERHWFAVYTMRRIEFASSPCVVPDDTKSKAMKEGEQQKSGVVHSLDGKRTISLEEFDRLADEGSDEIDDFIDWSKARRVEPTVEQVILLFHAPVIEALDREASREGISRQNLVERWVKERLDNTVAKTP